MIHFGPCYLASKGLQKSCNKLKSKQDGGGSFREALVHLRVGKWANSPSLFVRIAKKSEQLKSNVPKHTLKVFWVTTLVTEKKLSKKLLKGANLV